MTYRRPTMMQNGKQRLVSRVVMERVLGRPLSTDELVHHINHDPFDNRPENLELVSRSEHKKLHAEIGAETRLKKKWHLDGAVLVEAFKIKSASVIANEIGCGLNTVTRALRKHLTGGARLRVHGQPISAGKQTMKGKRMKKPVAQSDVIYTGQVRQGDVLVEAAAEKDLRGLKQTRPTAAHGERTGHHHTFEGKNVTGFYKEGDAEVGAQTMAGGAALAKFVKITGEFSPLVHQEHGPIKQAGIRRNRRQLQYQRQIQRAAD